MKIDTDKLTIANVTIIFEGGIALTVSAAEAVEILTKQAPETEAPVIIESQEEQPVYEEAPAPAPANVRTGIFNVSPEITTVTKVDGGYDIKLLYGETDKSFRVRISDALLSECSGDVEKKLADLPTSGFSFPISYVVEEDENGKYCKATGWVDLTDAK